MAVVALAVALVFSTLALVHVHWALGGRWGFDGAVPEVNGKKTITPGPAITLVVAGLLALAAATVVLRSQLVVIAGVPSVLPRVGTWVLAVAFGLRALGDFATVGAFKRVKNTRFARLDSLVYSPLCVAIALGCALVGARG